MLIGYGFGFSLSLRFVVNGKNLFDYDGCHGGEPI